MKFIWDVSSLLDWDKPLSEESERVRGAIESLVPQAREPMVMVGDKPFHEWAAPGMKAGENITPRDVARVKVKNAVSRAGGNVLDAERLLHSELGEGGAPEFRQSIADLFNGLREVQDSVHTVPSGVDMRMRPSELARGSKLFTPESAAASMREAGIPGIKYLDQGSRAAGEGTRNYVVFPGNEHLIEIMKKYGVTLPVAGQILDEMRQSMTPMTSHESD